MESSATPPAAGRPRRRATRTSGRWYSRTSSRVRRARCTCSRISRSKNPASSCAWSRSRPPTDIRRSSAATSTACSKLHTSVIRRQWTAARRTAAPATSFRPTGNRLPRAPDVVAWSAAMSQHRFALLTVVLLFSVDATAQQVIPLWEKGAPGFEARRNEPEQHQDWWYKNIHNPSLTVFLPAAGKANGTAVVIAPGGGHRELVFNPEGVERAQYLASLGVTAFALKYRLFREPGSKYTIDNTAEDIRRAMRTVRARAGEWRIDPKRIGIMGWSAGGEVAALVAYPPVEGNAKSVEPIARESAP